MDGVTLYAPARTATSAPRTNSAVNILYAITGGPQDGPTGRLLLIVVSSLTLSGLLNLLTAKVTGFFSIKLSCKNQTMCDFL